jgi:superfamily I DNA/RNA helicase
MFDSLSPIQRTIVFNKSGKFVIRACPGSGKTYSVAARLARLLGEWDKKHQGIAAISFTNAAWQEIESQLKNNFGMSAGIRYPHFLGTIDSFINQNFFLPFGHHVLGCSSRPVMVGEPYGPWHGRNFSESYFDNITFDSNGKLIALNERIMPKCEKTLGYIASAKKSLLKAGYAIQHDADFFAMKVLEDYPQIASAIVHRYPALIIDEAQDTSTVQMKILMSLIQHGLQEIMLVGDPDQAIFEWNEAKPHLFNEKYREWEVNSLELNENRRSSQKICDCTCKLASLSATSKAITDSIKDIPFDPIICTFDLGNISVIIEEFIRMCQDNDIEVNKENVAVISRSKDICGLALGIVETNIYPWKNNGDYYTKDLAKGKYLFDIGEIKKGFQLIEKAYVKMRKGINVCRQSDIEARINEIGFPAHRKEVFKMLSILPFASGSIGQWVKQANTVMSSLDITATLSIKSSKKDATFDQIFSTEKTTLIERNYRLGTVHSVKGETFEAVLLILKQKGIGKYYKTLIKDNVSISDNEELRIVYVGITRPRKLLMMAVPDEENRVAWNSKLLS